MWIACKDKMPTEKGHYAVWNGDKGPFSVMTYCIDRDWTEQEAQGAMFRSRIFAWLKLPPPPSQEK